MARLDAGRTGRIRCAAGRCTLGRVELVETSVTVEGDDETGERYKVQADIGAKLMLAEGFVNVGRRHPAGPAWYGRPKRPKDTGVRRVRPPVVVTCSCGLDNLIDQLVDAEAKAMATASADERVELADALLQGTAEDAATAVAIDRDREMGR